MSNVKVHKPQGGDSLEVESGGAINVADGGAVALGASITLTVSGVNVVITGLPIADPSVAGALYSDSGVLTLSAG